MLPPLFLSSEAHASAIRIFEAVKFEDKPFVENAVHWAREHLAWHPWSEYDQTYLALYTLALLGRGEPVILDQISDVVPGLPHRDDLLFLLDIGLVGRDSPYKLLDERGVAQIINFRHALEGFFPFDIHPSAVIIDALSSRFDAIPRDDYRHGKVAMMFDVLLPSLPALGLEGDGSGAAFLSSFFTGETWKEVTKRFNVDTVAVDAWKQSL